LAPRRALEIVVVNDPRKEFIGKQRGFGFKVHRLSHGLPAASRIGRRDSRKRVRASACSFSCEPPIKVKTSALWYWRSKAGFQSRLKANLLLL
jgi:hypothetical protein